MGTTIGMVSRLEIGDAPVAFTVWDTKLNSYPEVVSFTHINRTKGTEMIEQMNATEFPVLANLVGVEPSAISYSPSGMIEVIKIVDGKRYRISIENLDKLTPEIAAQLVRERVEALANS